MTIFLLERHSEKSGFSLHKFWGHDHIVIVGVVRVSVYAEFIAVCSKLCLLQSLVQTFDLVLHLVDAGLELGQKIVLKLLHGTFLGCLDFGAVLGQFTFFQ